MQKFGNNNQNNDKPHTTTPQFINDMYPYGQFPSQYTKSNDAKTLHTPPNINNNLTNNSCTCGSCTANDHLHKNDNNLQNDTHFNAATTTNHTNSNSNGAFSGMDLANLLPLMTNMKSNNKLNTFDMFNLLMPTLSKDNPNMGELMNYFKQNNAKVENKKLPPSKMQAIDSYIKV